MPAQTPSQEIAVQIKSLQTKIGSMQGDARLNSLRDSIEDIQSSIHGLGSKIAEIRTRGYVFERNLEEDAKSLEATWKTLYPNISGQITAQSNLLMIALHPLESQLAQLVSLSPNPLAAKNKLNQVQSAADQLESKIKASKEMVEGMYDKFSSQMDNISRHISDIEFMLQNLSEATFQLLPTESGIMAVKAVWCKSGKETKEDPEGVLFLTDQRVIFEQKEQVATKKVLFIATEKKMVQMLQFDIPVTLVDSILAHKSGMLNKDDLITVSMQPGASHQAIHLHIWQDGAVWHRLINRARMKDFEIDRVVALDQDVVARVKAAPTQCPSCGGAITKPVLRGQDTIKCEYCGFETRL